MFRVKASVVVILVSAFLFLLPHAAGGAEEGVVSKTQFRQLTQQLDRIEERLKTLETKLDVVSKDHDEIRKQLQGIRFATHRK